MKFFKFIKCLFKKKTTVIETQDVADKKDVRQMSFLSSEVEGDREVIRHGNDEYIIEIVIKRNIESRDGTVTVRVVKGNLRLSVKDSVWLVQKYL